METTQESTLPAAAKLSKEERSKIAKEAAKRRWAKAKRAKKTAVKAKGKKHSGPREFSSALKMAEKRLAKAIQERAEAGAKYAVLSAEIPSLQRIITALGSPLGAQLGLGVPSLEEIVGDQPLSYQNPPLAVQVRTPLVSPKAHPVTSQGRAMGGAVGVELQEEENDNKFLETSGVAGGEWH